MTSIQNNDKISLDSIGLNILLAFSNIDSYSILNDNILSINEDYDMCPDEKNSDDCVDIAIENGKNIIEKFPELEVSDIYCSRNKHAIVDLKFKI